MRRQYPHARLPLKVMAFSLDGEEIVITQIEEEND